MKNNKEDKYVEWFKKMIYKIQDNIIAQKTYIEQVAEPNYKAERIVLGKKVYGMLNDGLGLKSDKNNMIFGLPIAIDCNDDWLIAVCRGCKSNAQDLFEDIKEDS